MRFKLPAVVAALVFSNLASAGRIVINSDEWTLANTGFANAGGSNGANFAVNLATFLAGPGGNILVYSSNFGLTQSSLANALTGAGFNITTSTGAFNPAGFDAIFLADAIHSATTSDLVNFVNSGGGVYIAAGTASSAPGLAASLFNPFLTSFGLQYANFHELFSSNDSIDSGSHPLFSGVSQLFYAGVNPVGTTGSSPFATVVERRNTTNPFGLIAVFDDTAVIPEPGTLLFGSIGVMCLALIRLGRLM